jgi:hypothetical protein
MVNFTHGLRSVKGYRVVDVTSDSPPVSFTAADLQWAIRSASLGEASDIGFNANGQSIGNILEWVDPRDTIQINGHYTPSCWHYYDTPRDISSFDIQVTTVAGTPITTPATIIGIVIELCHD